MIADALPLLLTVKDVAEMCHLGVRTIWRHVSTGDFPAPLTIGRRLKRWNRESIERWIAAKAEGGQR